MDNIYVQANRFYFSKLNAQPPLFCFLFGCRIKQDISFKFDYKIFIAKKLQFNIRLEAIWKHKLGCISRLRVKINKHEWMLH